MAAGRGNADRFRVGCATGPACRRSTSERPLTPGTAGYLAPELIRKESDAAKLRTSSRWAASVRVPDRRPPFVGSNLTAVLTQFLFEEAYRCVELRPEVPPSLDTLVLRMLAKDPVRTTAGRRSAPAELTALGELGGALPLRAERAPAITSGEERLVTVIVSAPPAPEATARKRRQPRWFGAPAGRDACSAKRSGGPDRTAGRPLARDRVSPDDHGTALDMVERAVRSSLLAKGPLARRRVAVATGRGQFPQKMPMGEAVERASRLADRGLFPIGAAYVLTDELTFDWSAHVWT